MTKDDRTAPKIADIKQTTKEVSPETTAPTTKPVPGGNLPSLTFYGCGGFGINLIRLIKTSNIDNKASFDVQFRNIDTSKSNIMSNDDADIIEGNGSGQIRKSNLEAINTYVSSKAFATVQPADINVVMFSLSGGTGSVIGPLLIKELERRNKAVVAITVADLSSQLYTDNTYKTIASLESICSSTQMYLPTMVFDNAASRATVDNNVVHKANLMIRYLTMDTIEMDKSDKINFFKPDVAVGAAPGIKTLYISKVGAEKPEDSLGEVFIFKDDFIYDATTLITVSTSATITHATRVVYHGINPAPESSNDKILAVVGAPIAEEFVGKVNDSLARYKAHVPKTAKINFQAMTHSAQEDDTGLII